MLRDEYNMFYVFKHDSTKYYITKVKYNSLPDETKKQFTNLAPRDYVSPEYKEWK
jgi:hypothetical protein